MTGGGPFWEVTSDFILPPVSPSVELLDKSGKRVWPGSVASVSRVGGLYNSPELHYRASDLRAIDSFDIAKTYESFGIAGTERKPDYCPIIVSKKFYELCQHHNFKVDWLPVHIDPV